jgi:hypothetical protein
MTWIAFLMLAAATASTGGSGAEIVNSGSTNMRGYLIEVSRSGRIVVDAPDGTGPRDASVPGDLADRFFAALDAAKPLGALPRRHCAKSVSFGYSIHIRYDGASSPDLTCPLGAQEESLASLTSEIARAAEISNQPRRLVPEP